MTGRWQTQCPFCRGWNALDTHESGTRCGHCGRHIDQARVLGRSRYDEHAEPRQVRRIVARYALTPEDRDEHARLFLPIPRDALILYATNQGQFAAVLYVLLPDAETVVMEERTVYMVQTGEPFIASDHCQPVGVAALLEGADEWHVFVEPATATTQERPIQRLLAND